MPKNKALQFAPRQLAEDYDLNDVVERYVAELVGELAGENPSDFSKGVRTSHDWVYVGDGSGPPIKIELKTSNEVEYPIELSKDKDGKIKSGIAATEADVVIILSQGRGAIPEGKCEGPPIGKLRAFFPKSLLASTRGREPFRYIKGKNITEDAYAVRVNLTTIRHWHLGDVPTILASDGETWMYDMEKFIPARNVGPMVTGLFQEIREQKQERSHS